MSNVTGANPMGILEQRVELISEIQELERRKAAIIEYAILNGGATGDDNRDIRHLKREIKYRCSELSKLKTKDWLKNDTHFNRAFKYMARKMLEPEEYEAILRETVNWLQARHGNDYLDHKER